MEFSRMHLNVLRNLENKKGPPLPALAVGTGILVLLLFVTGAVVYAWAPTLTEMRMDGLRPGMTEAEVRERMGPPSRSNEANGYPVWLYDTWRKSRQPYVVFSTNRVVRAFGVAD